MYTRDHGKAHMKNTTPSWRKAVKRGQVKALRQQDRHAERRCPYCGDDTCGGWCA